jgi:hypothetical protein
MIFYTMRRLRMSPAGRQSSAIALGLAAAVALVGAVVWGLVEYLIHYQLSLLGVAIGAGIGAVVAKYRPGHWPTIIGGAMLAVLSCAFGTFLAVIFGLLNLGFSMSTILGHLNGVIRAYPHAINGIGVLFWAVAAFVAIRIPVQSHTLNRRASAAPPGYPGAPPQPYGAPPQPYGTPPQPYGTPPQPFGADPQAFGGQGFGTGQAPPDPPPAQNPPL